MTEMEQGNVPSFDSSSSAESTPAPVSQPTQSEERTFRQSEVNDLIGRAKSEAVDRYKRESSIASHQSPPQTSINASNTQGLSHDEIRRMAAEEAQKMRNTLIEEAQQNAQKQDAERIANEFSQKLHAGKERYQDYDSVMEGMDFSSIWQIVHVANAMDNTADIMYDLAKNPSKIATIHQLLSINPNLAISEMRRLSQSIKDNSHAQEFRHPNEPLSQLRPSNNGMDSKAPHSASDYRKMPEYRV